MFRVFEVDDYGNAINYYGVFKATSKLETRELASLYWKNKGILTAPGFYEVKEVTEEELEKEKTKIRELLERKTKILN